MLGFFKKKEPESLTSKSTYYERECVITFPTDIFLLLSDVNIFNFKDTDVPISVSNISMNNVTSKMVITIMDTPKYLFDNTENIEGHKVLFYKEEADIYRFLLQFHFINDKLFFVANKIYTGMTLPDSNKIKIVQQLAQKYFHLTNYQVPEEYSIFISDQIGNKVFTSDGVYFYVNYVTGDSIQENLWRKYSFLEKELAKAKSDSFDESLNKFL